MEGMKLTHGSLVTLTSGINLNLPPDLQILLNNRGYL